MKTVKDSSEIPWGVVKVNGKDFWHVNTFQLQKEAERLGLSGDVHFSRLAPAGFTFDSGCVMREKKNKLLGCMEYLIELKKK